MDTAIIECSITQPYFHFLCVIKHVRYNMMSIYFAFQMLAFLTFTKIQIYAQYVTGSVIDRNPRVKSRTNVAVVCCCLWYILYCMCLPTGHCLDHKSHNARAHVLLCPRVAHLITLLFLSHRGLNALISGQLCSPLSSLHSQVATIPRTRQRNQPTETRNQQMSSPPNDL